MNFVYADVDGNIGWIPAGCMPRRPQLGRPDAGRPATAATNGTASSTQDELPSLYNPARGWVATANEMNLPDGYPAEERNIGFEWADPAAGDRIDAGAGGQRRMTPRRLAGAADRRLQRHGPARRRPAARPDVDRPRRSPQALRLLARLGRPRDGRTAPPRPSPRCGSTSTSAPQTIARTHRRRRRRRDRPSARPTR